MYGLSLDVNLLKSLTEPVGAKAPAFSTDALSQTISRKDGQGFALLCLAQAYPVPMFRYGCKKISRLIYNLLKTSPLLVKKQVIQTLVLFEILFLVSVVISLSMYNNV